MGWIPEWGGNLLAQNRLTVRTYGSVVPDRAAAQKLARTLTTKGNPYLALSEKLDNSIKVEHSFVEESVRVSYLRIDRVRNIEQAKVLMKVDFALKLKLAEPIRELSAGVLENPCSADNVKYFYQFAKAYLAAPSTVDFNREHYYFAAPCQVDEYGNWRFALDLKLGESTLKNAKNYKADLLSFGNRSVFLESNGAKSNFFNVVKVPEASNVQITVRRRSEDIPVVAEDLEKSIEFLKTLPTTILKKGDDPFCRFFVCGGLQLFIHGLEKDVQKHAVRLSELGITELQRLLALHHSAERFCSDHDKEWVRLTTGKSLKKCCGVDFSSYDKFLANIWIEKIRSDPLMYTEHSCKCIKNYAQSIVLGVPYGC